MFSIFIFFLAVFMYSGIGLYVFYKIKQNYESQVKEFEDFDIDLNTNSENNTIKRIIPDDVHGDKATTSSTQKTDSKTYYTQEKFKEVDKIVINNSVENSSKKDKFNNKNLTNSKETIIEDNLFNQEDDDPIKEEESLVSKILKKSKKNL